MVRHIVKQRGLIMTGISQVEMKLHEQADQLAHLRHEVLKMKEQLEQTIVSSLRSLLLKHSPVPSSTVNCKSDIEVGGEVIFTTDPGFK